MGLFASKQITDLEAANASLTGQLAQASAEKGQLQERLTALEATAGDSAALEAVRAENVTLTANLAAANEKLGPALERVRDFEAAFPANGHFAFADGKVSLTEAGKTNLINAGIMTALASTGHGALSIGATVDTTAQASAPKLSGRERLKAETRKEFAAKTAVTITA